MQKDFAQKLVKETLQSSFNKEQFVYLAKNLLNHIEEESFNYKGNYIFDDFKDSISSVERIGKYKDPEDKLIDILIVKLKKEVSLERARARQRNFVAKYLKGSRGGILKDAALVAFVSPNEDDWRFSLVKMEYKFNEKGKVEEEFTPARRYSFLVGKNENSHTAQSRLAPLLINDEANPTLSELESVFSVEKVTKEFFQKYHEIFLKLKDSLDEILKKDLKIKKDFKAKNVDTVDFAKKLLGQIVFLYFLQKKGWFGVKRNEKWGGGSKRFLRELFEKKHGNYKNFFNDILEPLFYEALRLERPGDYYSHFDCRIPFLNGGLFDPINEYNWVDTEINLPNDIFSNDIKTKEGDIGSGILDIFDRYNFTVKEDEPLEKEVAVDPEMLGKVFENLLEIKDRKSKGTYYTPRDIVHYMCKESLINYIATATDINRERISQLMHFDHFMAQKLTKKRQVEALAMWKGEIKDIDIALDKIRIVDPACGSGAFLVGMMQEIIRIRKIISLFFKVNDISDYELKLNIIQNNLYGVDIDLGAVEIAKLRLWLSLIVDEEDIKQIRPLPNLDYKIVQGNSLLGFPYTPQGLEKIEKLKQQFFEENRPKVKEQLRSEINDAIKKLLVNTEISLGYKVDFDFKIFFSEVFHEKNGFDVVIANPPYGANIDKDVRIYRKTYNEVIKNYADIYKIFFCIGLRILRPGGIVTFITPNTYLAQPRYRDLRSYLLKFNIEKIINLGEEVFEDVVVPTCITFIKNLPQVDYYLFFDVSKKGKYPGILDDIHFLRVSINQVKQNIDLSLLQTFVLKENELLLDKILDVRDAGIQYHRSGIGLKNKGGNDLYDRLFNSDKNFFLKSHLVWYGKLINEYYISKKTDEYFNLDYKSVLKSNESVSFSNETFHKKDKLLWRQTAPFIIATIDNEGLWFRNTIQCGWLKDDFKEKIDLRFILALFNSNYLRYLYQKIVNESSERVFPQVKVTHVKKLPIRIISLVEQKPFINLVDKILVVTKSSDYLDNVDDKLKVREYKKQIDQLVYKLYGLTDEEIKIVEDVKK